MLMKPLTTSSELKRVGLLKRQEFLTFLSLSRNNLLNDTMYISVSPN